MKILNLRIPSKGDCIVLIFSLILFFPSQSFSVNDFKSDTTKTNVQTREVRVYTTERLSTPKPVIDGKLDDPCWKTGNWAGDFTQWIPNEGAKPSHPTFVKVLYDDKNVYVAI